MDSLLWRGVMAYSSSRRRTMAIVAVMVLSTCIVFSQKTFLAVVPRSALAVYGICLLAPVALGALLLGTRTGALLGLFAGTMLYIHANIMPLDYQEITIVTPVSSMGMFSAFAFVTALLFGAVLPKAKSFKARVAGIVTSCLATSLLGSLAVMALTPYNPSLVESILQVLVDTAITSLPCLGLYVLAIHVQAAADNIGVREAFRVAILIVVTLAFAITSTISYVTVTLDEAAQADAAIKSEVNYLCLQLESLGQRANAFKRVVDSTNSLPELLRSADPKDYKLLSDPVGDVLDGYTMEQTGTVIIMLNDKVLKTDDQRIPVGTSITEFGDNTQSAIRESVANGDLRLIVYGGILTTDGDTGGYDHNAQVAFLRAEQHGSYTVVIIEPSSMVFHDRVGVIGREAAITLILLVVVFVLVAQMLGALVAGRIDKTNEALERITAGDLNTRVEVAGTREFKSLSAGINTTVDALQDLIAEAHRRMEQDLKTARAIQEGALPRRFPAFTSVPMVDLFASMDAARDVGGDFYDYFELDDHTVAFLIADVSGKGIPGALFMMAAKAEIQNYLSTGMGLANAIGAANKYLCDNNEAGMFVTVWAATLDWHTGLLTYVNAGHNFPLLRHGQGGSWEWLKQKCGLFLGTFDTAKYREMTITLEPGDELVLYTDGVNEAFNIYEEEYGNDRLEAFLTSHANERPQELAEGLRANVAAWAQGAEQSDDITILVLEYDAQGLRYAGM